MARDGQNIDKWYKEWLKGLTNPTGARGWQPDEAAQDWVNNAIEKIFGKGTTNRTMQRVPGVVSAGQGWYQPALTNEQVNELANWNNKGWYQPNLTPEQVSQLALMGNPVYQLNQAIGWQPTYAPQYGTAEESLANLRSEQANQNLTKTGNYYEKDGVLYANEPLRRDWSTNLYYGENSEQLYGQRWNQDKGVYDYTFTGTERNKYGQPAGTSTFGKNTKAGFAGRRGPGSVGGKLSPGQVENMFGSFGDQLASIENSIANYKFTGKQDSYAAARSRARYNKLLQRRDLLKGHGIKNDGMGTENATSGTGVGWSW